MMGSTSVRYPPDILRLGLAAFYRSRRGLDKINEIKLPGNRQMYRYKALLRYENGHSSNPYVQAGISYKASKIRQFYHFPSVCTRIAW